MGQAVKDYEDKSSEDDLKSEFDKHDGIGSDASCVGQIWFDRLINVQKLFIDNSFGLVLVERTCTTYQLVSTSTSLRA